MEVNNKKGRVGGLYNDDIFFILFDKIFDLQNIFTMHLFITYFAINKFTKKNKKKIKKMALPKK